MRARRGRGAGVGALLIAWMVGGASASGCDWVLGIDQVEVGCYGGEKRCDGQRPQTCDEQGQWVSDDPCENATCINGRCQGVCAPGQGRCEDNARRPCGADGAWAAVLEECTKQACVEGECRGDCEPEQKRCSTSNTKMPQVCNSVGQWEDEQECPSTCDNGECRCKQGEQQCSGNTPQECDENGEWVDLPTGACIGRTCRKNHETVMCVGVCEHGTKRCIDDMWQACDENGEWADPQACGQGQTCQAGTCIVDCSPGDLRCHDNRRQACDGSGLWQDVEDCDIRGGADGSACFLDECIGICIPGGVRCNIATSTSQDCDVTGQWVNTQGTACCADGVQDGAETGVDCGGACNPCDDLQGCAVPGDCVSGVCVSGICQSSTCDDGMRNGMETDIDCGAFCPKRCMSGQACVMGVDCVSGTCMGLICIGKPPGSLCLDAGECESGYCVDGVCCDQICSGVCRACTAAKKGYGQDGVCAVIVQGADPDDECALLPASTCGSTGFCDGLGACRLYAAGTICSPAVCVDGATLEPADTCNGLGGCIDSGIQSCSPQACINGACQVP